MAKDSKDNSKYIRPPVVVIVGHVDHGKTSVLDYIRKTKVAAGEAGGITQHIGAYQAEHNGKIVTFLDTPGHEAFSAIRSRGCQVADVAVLIVAAEEGVKPQTKEAIKFIKEANIPFIVAINKIDKEGANPQKIKQELAENDVLVEGWGGQVSVVEISAKTGQGIDELMDILLLTSELEELSADLDQNAEGVVIDAHLDHKRGAVATLLVINGKLKVGQFVAVSGQLAKIKSLENFNGERFMEALPSQPVLILGWSSIPRLGSSFKVFDIKGEAEKYNLENLSVERSEIFLSEEGPIKENKKLLGVIFKADTHGSLEAIDKTIKLIINEEVGYKVIDYGVGNISEQDVKKVIAVNGIVLGFNVEIEGSAGMLAKKEGIEIGTFTIIYELIENLRKHLSSLLEPEIKKIISGKIKILAIFKKDNKIQVVGGKVISGRAKRGLSIDVIREGTRVASGKLLQLQQNKEEAEEVREGLECGIRFQGDPVIKEGDVLEIYEEEKIVREV